MSDDGKLDDTAIKLYSLLVDSLHKYNSVIWQIPAALLAVNTFALDKFSKDGVLLLALAFFDIALVYTFQRMVTSQQKIIAAARKAENEFKKNYDALIPEFKEGCLRAPKVMVFVLWFLVVALFVRALILLGPCLYLKH